MKKKILYIHHGKGIGGAPLSLLYLVQALDKSLYDPVVLFLHHSDAVQLFKDHNIPVLGPVNRYDFPHTTIWWLRWYHALFFIRVLWNTLITTFFTAPYWIKKVQPDLIHLNTSSLIAWGIAGHRHHIPVVWHIRERLAQGYIGCRHFIIQKIIATCASKIIPICHYDAQPWAHNKKVSVVYNAAQKTRFDYTISPTDFINQHHRAQDNATILFLGGLSYEKGTGFLLDVFADVIQRIPHAHLLIAGYCDMSYQKSTIKRFFPAYQFKQQVAQRYHQLSHAITLLGAINHVPQAMAASDIVVFPALVGHFARPVIEAGFMKKPVVVSHKPPLNELVIHEKTGFLIDPLNHKAWVDALVLLLSDHAMRTTMGEHAYTFATQQFSLDHQVKTIQATYSTLLNQKEYRYE